MSFNVNTPKDDESNYCSERVTRDTVLVQERTISQKDFPNISASRIQDTESVKLASYSSFNGQATVFKFPQSSTYHNVIASTVNQ
jgi:exonuclease III